MNWTIFVYGGITIWVFVTAVWIISLLKKDAGLMDVFWGIGFILVSSLYYIMAEQTSVRAILILIMLLLWGVRLSMYIGIRNHGKPEDARYAKWRKENGSAWWWRSYFNVFLLQGVIMWILSIPFFVVATVTEQGGLGAIEFAGIGLFLIGFIYETFADAQLKRFKNKQENRGKIFSGGLWKYSRHPNYFGEAVLWWGFGLLAAGTGQWWVLISPLI
ncbi:DUF1295 domain-containing protein, partial [bacterium]|nr:DUF1295 domain-containing protein [bacterium]